MSHSSLPKSSIPLKSRHSGQVCIFDGHSSVVVADVHVSTSLDSVPFSWIEPLYLLQCAGAVFSLSPWRCLAMWEYWGQCTSITGSYGPL